VRVDLEMGRRLALVRARSLRVLGPVGSSDMVMIEDRVTGERRRVPNKFILLHKHAVAFEMAPAGPGFEDEASLTDEE
jgi:hypothetical protein